MKRIRKRVPIWLNIANPMDGNIYQWIQELSASRTENLTETFRQAFRMVWAVKKRDWAYLAGLVPEFVEWIEKRQLARMKSDKRQLANLETAMQDLQKQIHELQTVNGNGFLADIATSTNKALFDRDVTINGIPIQE